MSYCLEVTAVMSLVLFKSQDAAKGAVLWHGGEPYCNTVRHIWKLPHSLHTATAGLHCLTDGRLNGTGLSPTVHSFFAPSSLYHLPVVKIVWAWSTLKIKKAFSSKETTEGVYFFFDNKEKKQSVVGISLQRLPMVPPNILKHHNLKTWWVRTASTSEVLILICRCVYWSFTSDICWCHLWSQTCTFWNKSPRRRCA